ncbi:MAG TPA: hypothetical protein VJ728_14750 [Candidatus Binataceae bacterium]|nr:hypothetical protein [Candidatus Binataceae bacterium]
MRVFNKAVVILVPSLLFGFGVRAWSASSDQAVAVNAQVVPANPNSTSSSVLDLLKPVLTHTDRVQRQTSPNCTASNMYSQHDVVGDPESCVMGHISGAFGQIFAPVSVP